MRVSPTFIPVGVGAWAVGDGRALGVWYVVWGALAATAVAAGREYAHNCVPYPANPDTSTPPIRMNTMTPLDLTVMTQEAQTVLYLSVGSETIELEMGKRRARCNVGRSRRTGEAHDVTEEGKEGLLRFYVYNQTLFINGISVCENASFGEEGFSLKVEKASGNVAVVFNCVKDHCNFHYASLTLDPASAKGYSFVRTLTKGATADIEVFDCPDEARANPNACESLGTNTLEGVDVDGKAFKGDWQRLHFETEGLEERSELLERRIAVLVVGDFLKAFEMKNNPVLTINKTKGMEFATDCKVSLTNVHLCAEQPAEAPPTAAPAEPGPGEDSVWLPVAVALLVLLAIVALVSVAVCFRLRRRASSQEPEALRQSSACAHPALPSSPSPSLAEGKSPLTQRYSTLITSDAVAVPNGRSKGGGGGHRSQASRDLSGLPDLAPPPLPSTSPPSLPHHPDGASPPTEAADVRRTLEWRDHACHGDAKDPQEAPWSGADDGEGEYADPKELEAPPWLRIPGADDDEEHDYDYIDRDALRIMLDKDKEEAQQRSLATEEGRLSRHDSENSLYEEMKALEAARERSALEERRRREQQQREEQEQEIQEGKQEKQGDEEEQNEQMEDSEQEILQSVKL